MVWQHRGKGWVYSMKSLDYFLVESDKPSFTGRNISVDVMLRRCDVKGRVDDRRATSTSCLITW